MCMCVCVYVCVCKETRHMQMKVNIHVHACLSLLHYREVSTYAYIIMHNTCVYIYTCLCTSAITAIVNQVQSCAGHIHKVIHTLPRLNKLIQDREEPSIMSKNCRMTQLVKLIINISLCNLPFVLLAQS